MSEWGTFKIWGTREKDDPKAYDGESPVPTNIILRPLKLTPMKRVMK